MFPLKADDPYINKDGSRTTLGNITGDISGIIGDIDDLDDRLDKVADSVTPISQTGTKATAAITSGAYFYLDGVLVKAIANIAIDDTFTANTNYEVVTAGGLNTLASQISNLQNNYNNLNTNVGNLRYTSVSGNTDEYAQLDTGIQNSNIIAVWIYNQDRAFAVATGSTSTTIRVCNHEGGYITSSWISVNILYKV